MSRKNYLFAVLVLINYTNLTIAAEADTEEPKYPRVEQAIYTGYTLYSIPETDLFAGLITNCPDGIREEQKYSVNYNRKSITTHKKRIFDSLELIYKDQATKRIPTSPEAFEAVFDRLGIKYKKVIR